MSLHCLFTGYLSIHCLITVYSLSYHCLFTVYIFATGSVVIPCVSSLPNPVESLYSLLDSLSSHRLFTVYSLSIHCLFTVYSLFYSLFYSLSIRLLATVTCPLPVQCLYIPCLCTELTVQSVQSEIVKVCLFRSYLCLQYLLTLYSRAAHCLLTVRSLSIHSLCTVGVLSMWFTAYSLPLHSLFTAYVVTVHNQFTVHSLPIHCVYSLCLFTVCLFISYPHLFTVCSLSNSCLVTVFSLRLVTVSSHCLYSLSSVDSE
jgi:hypothetical protein